MSVIIKLMMMIPMAMVPRGPCSLAAWATEEVPLDEGGPGGWWLGVMVPPQRAGGSHVYGVKVPCHVPCGVSGDLGKGACAPAAILHTHTLSSVFARCCHPTAHACTCYKQH